MKRWEQIGQRRTTFIETEQQRLQRLVQAFQRGLALDIAEIAAELNLSATEVRQIQNNYQLISRAQTVTESRYRVFARTMTERLLSGVQTLFGLNTAFFTAQKLPATGVALGVEQVVLTRLGFDPIAQRVLPGSWLDSFNKPEPLVQRVATSIQTALQGEQGARAFRKELREQIAGSNGLGYGEQHFNTFVRDIYKRTDSATQLAYADALELNYARYAGVAMDASRPFCLARLNKIYTRKEIESWRELDFQGKPKVGYDPFTDLGGYNCTHTFNWISDEMVELLGEPVNEYNK
jgi:hypothetical protein